MTLPELIKAVQIEMGDSAASLFTTEEINRAIKKGSTLLSRYYSKKSLVETSLTTNYTSEALVIASSTGTITHAPLRYNLETIKNPAGVAMVRDTNYTINYLTGVVTEIGALLPDGNYTVTYTIDQQLFNFATLVPTFMRIEDIEYPVGQIPQLHPSFDVVNRSIICLSGDNYWMNNYHMRILYSGIWTPPTETADGDYPEHLDEVVIYAACGTLCLMQSSKKLTAAATSYASGTSALSSIATPLGSGLTALAAVDADESAASSQLSQGATPLADADTALDAVATAESNARGKLSTGAGKIETLNAAGQQVATQYKEQAEIEVGLGNNRANEGSQRIAVAEKYRGFAEIEAALGSNRVNQGAQYRGIAEAYNTSSQNHLAVGEGYRNVANFWYSMATYYFTQFNNILGIKAEQGVSSGLK
jgi:hypothetical protein